MSCYLNYFEFLKPLVDEEVSSLSKELKGVPPRDLALFVLANALSVVCDVYGILRALVKHLRVLERGVHGRARRPRT